MTMRVTTLMLSRGILDDVNSAGNRLARTQQKLASGKELTRPSDDPTAVARALQMRTAMEGAQQHQRTVGQSQGWADVTDSALESINDALQRARALAVQGANGTLDQGQRDALKREVTSLIDTVKEAGNATYAPARPFEAVDVRGYDTLRQVAWLGSYEGRSGFGIGTRARLPFRVFVVEGGSARVDRLVIDVAHRWQQ